MSDFELDDRGVLAKRLKQIYERSLAAKEKKRDESKTAASSADPGESGPHTDAGAPLKGVLAKGDRYARRAFAYLKAQDGRGVYRNFDFPHLDQIREQVRAEAEFPGGPKQNFNPTYAQQFPYSWAAHHMIPGETFYSEVDGKPIFSFKALRLILQTDYNINHGHNQILLPMEDWASPVHTLLCHPSDHPNYTVTVAKDLNRVSTDLQSKIDQAQPHDTLKADVFQDLKNLEEKCWKVIVKLSRVAVPNAYKGIQFVDDRVKWKTADKAYDFPALG